MRSSRPTRLVSRGIRAPQRRLVVLKHAIRLCSSCEIPTKKAHAVASPPVPPADHRELGTQQELFIGSKYSPGSPLFLPNGANIFNNLVAFLRAQYVEFGFQEVITPTIYKKALWDISGHWQNYAKDMFSVQGRSSPGQNESLEQDEEFGLKPMNCPGHCLVFASKKRSYRDLPIRYADFSPLHRNEISGALSGLTRVRRFHQDDGHVFCRPSQVAEEISKTLEFVKLAYGAFGLGSYRLALSTRPTSDYIGTEQEWDNAESALRQSLESSGQEWSIQEGEGAFYGPKIDIILKDSDGKEHQTATVQLDFQLPKRFQLEYTAPAPDQERIGAVTTDPQLLAHEGSVAPVMIHRAILGSVERFMALLIEHYNGHWPFWLNPNQVRIITVNDEASTLAYAQRVQRILQGRSESSETSSASLRALNTCTLSVGIDDAAETLKKKILKAKKDRCAVLVVIGRKDVENGNIISADLSTFTWDERHREQYASILEQASESRSDAAKSLATRDHTPEKDLRKVQIAPHSLRQLLATFHSNFL